MKHHAIRRAAPRHRKNDWSLAQYIVALVLEAGLLYYAFSLALLGYIPPHYRLIGVLVLFPLAAMAAWWGGTVYLRRKHEIRQHPMLVFTTLPVRIFLGVSLAAAVVSVMALFGYF
jgi:hypothetical protein